MSRGKLRLFNSFPTHVSSKVISSSSSLDLLVALLYAFMAFTWRLVYMDIIIIMGKEETSYTEPAFILYRFINHFYVFSSDE
jgi:hypothetical protein